MNDDSPMPLSAIEFADDEVVPIKELTELYESVDWTAHAVDPDALAKAVDRSTFVVTARDPEGELVGLARCLTDDVYVLLVNEVVVRPDHQRMGIGTVLLGRCLAVHDHVHQTVLLADATPALRGFFEAFEFDEPSANHQICFVKRND